MIRLIRTEAVTLSTLSAFSLHSIIDWKVTRWGVPVSLGIRPSFGRVVVVVVTPRSSSLLCVPDAADLLCERRRSLAPLSVGVCTVPDDIRPLLCSELSLPILFILSERLCGRTTAYPPLAVPPAIENLISSHTSALVGSCVPDPLPTAAPFAARCLDPDLVPMAVGGLVREKKLLIRSNGVGRFSLSFSSFCICS
uniref:Uncharacterized protein n=1 Tax=Anopheles maculatus TaxID=74869 RepID=A0A182SP36_9DIPT